MCKLLQEIPLSIDIASSIIRATAVACINCLFCCIFKSVIHLDIYSVQIAWYIHILSITLMCL